MIIMADDLSPKILVKKADGSYVHMSLSDIQKKATASSAAPAPAAPASAPVKPITPKPLPAAAQPKIEKPEPISLLEEPVPIFKEAAPLTSVTKEKQVDEIIKSLSFKTPVQNDSRLRSILLSFLKDVRGGAEFIEIMMRSEIAGGVGLSETQANEIFKKAGEVKTGKKEPEKTINLAKPVSVKSNPKENERLEKEVPMVRSNFSFPKTVPSGVTTLPATAKNLAVKIEPQKAVQVSIAAKIEKPAVAFEPSIFKNDVSKARGSMNDVKAPPLALGPVDEIKAFSLVDFRRLSTNPSDAAKRLKQKFLNLREESVVMFFEALDAWHTAPLYNDYLALVSDALKGRQPLMRVAAVDNKKIQSVEIAAILQMEKELSMV